MTTDDNTTVDVDTQRAQKFLDGLRQEREIYGLLGKLSEQQAAILSNGVSDEILQLAQAKEAELLRISEVEGDLQPLKQEWKVLRERIDESLRAEIDGELAEIEVLLKRLIDLEAEGQRNVDMQVRKTSAKLRQVDGGRKLQRAYGTGAANAKPRYLDRSE
ncbi:MAG: hypothetical protein AAF581_10660 [Planctomycetota bacterium]